MSRSLVKKDDKTPTEHTSTWYCKLCQWEGATIAEVKDHMKLHGYTPEQTGAMKGHLLLALDGGGYYHNSSDYYDADGKAVLARNQSGPA